MISRDCHFRVWRKAAPEVCNANSGIRRDARMVSRIFSELGKLTFLRVNKFSRGATEFMEEKTREAIDKEDSPAGAIAQAAGTVDPRLPA